MTTETEKLPQDRKKIRECNRLYYESHKSQCRERMRRYYEQHRDKLMARNRIGSRKRNLELKIKALSYYGGGKVQCVVCGENRLSCLSIDHINGRKTIIDGKDHTRRGDHMYWWLKKYNYPEGYQTLCMNCQWIKRAEKKDVPIGLTPQQTQWYPSGKSYLRGKKNGSFEYDLEFNLYFLGFPRQKNHYGRSDYYSRCCCHSLHSSKIPYVVCSPNTDYLLSDQEAAADV